MMTAPGRTLLLGTLNPDGSYTGITAAVGSVAVDVRGLFYLTVYLESAGAITGGTIVVEEAARPDFSGTWSQVTSVSASGLTGGAGQAIHLTPAAYGYVRVRVTVTIAGGGTLVAFLSTQGT